MHFPLKYHTVLLEIKKTDQEPVPMIVFFHTRKVGKVKMIKTNDYNLLKLGC